MMWWIWQPPSYTAKHIKRNCVKVLGSTTLISLGGFSLTWSVTTRSMFCMYRTSISTLGHCHVIDWDDARRYGPEYDQWLYKLAFQKMCYAFIRCDEHRSLLKDYI